MKKIITLVTLFASLFNLEVLSNVVKSYENYQVLRVEVASKENFEKLSLINGINFWNERMIEGEEAKVESALFYTYNAFKQLRRNKAMFM